jgi:hypothetical protein
MIEADRVVPVPAAGVSHEETVPTTGSHASTCGDRQRSELVGMAGFEAAASCSQITR